MKKVYLLIEHIEFEGDQVHGVFTTEELAKKHIEKIEEVFGDILIKEVSINSMIEYPLHEGEIIYDSRN